MEGYFIVEGTSLWRVLIVEGSKLWRGLSCGGVLIVEGI